MTALICLRYLTDENEPLADGTDDDLAVLREQASAIDPDDLLLLSEVHAIPPTAGWLAALVDELIEAAWGCRQAFERIMAARNRFPGGRAVRQRGVPGPGPADRRAVRCPRARQADRLAHRDRSRHGRR